MRLFRHWSVRSRLTALVAVAATLIVAALFAVLLANESRQSSNRLDETLRERIDAIELSLRTSGRLPYSEPYGEVIDADYKILGMSQAIELPGLLTQSQVDFVFRNGGLQFRRADDVLSGTGRFVAERRVPNDVPVVVVVGGSESVLRDARNQLRIALGFGGPFLVLLMAFGGWVLAGAVLRPVRRMTDDASAISQFESSSRLAVGQGADELAHLGTTLNSMLDRLDAAYQRERRLVDDASHELRTPLAIVRGELELALLDPSTTVSTVEALQRSLDEVDRLIALTNDLLVTARARNAVATSDEATLEFCNLDETLRALRDRRTGSPVLAWSWSFGAPGLDIALRADQLERVVRNLLDNAERYANHEVRCTTTLVDASNERVKLVVADDGPGFPEGFSERAFDRFSVANDARGRAGGGIGLGLAIVAELVGQAGGTVQAGNGTDGGAEVTIVLPAAPPSIQPPQ